MEDSILNFGVTLLDQRKLLRGAFKNRGAMEATYGK